jgi:hypothetical protein
MYVLVVVWSHLLSLSLNLNKTILHMARIMLIESFESITQMRQKIEESNTVSACVRARHRMETLATSDLSHQPPRISPTMLCLSLQNIITDPIQ